MSSNLGPERVDLPNDKLLHTFDRVLVFEAEVELGGASWFISRVMPDMEVLMVQCVFASDSPRGIEVKHLSQEIDSKVVGMGDKGSEGDSGFDGKRANVLLGAGRTNTAKGILRWCSQVVQNLVELINIAENV